MGTYTDTLRLYKPELDEKFNLNEHWNRNTSLIEEFARNMLSKSISKVELRRYTDFTPIEIAFYKGSNLYIVSTLSVLSGGNYTKCTVQIYDNAGSVVQDTITITIGYDGVGNVSSVTYSKSITIDLMSILDMHGVLSGGATKIKDGTIGLAKLAPDVKDYFAKKADLNSKIIIGSGEDIPVSSRVKGKLYFKVTDVQSGGGGVIPSDVIKVSPTMGIKYEE